jgi:hypothetical protein
VVLELRVDGGLFASEAGGPAQYGHWTDIEDQGETSVISGGDGRFRLVVPKAALGAVERVLVAARLGVDLASLAPGQRARITRPGSRGG